MNTLLSRTNAIFAFTLSILAALTFICSVSTAFKSYKDVVDVKIVATKKLVKNVADYSAGRERNDLGFISFNLDADFGPAFDWNTKQLFLYLTAQYRTASNALNQVVLWDRIIQRGEDANVKLRNQHTKYYFWDDGNGLLGNNNVTLSLSVNVIPNAGLLPISGVPSVHTFAFPNEYITNVNAKPAANL